MRTGVIIDQYKLLAMRLLPSSFFTAFVLKHGKPLLPTEHLSWARVISPQLQSELQPYTAPISGYRGRPVAELLVLRVPEKHYPISQQATASPSAAGSTQPVAGISHSHHDGSTVPYHASAPHPQHGRLGSTAHHSSNAHHATSRPCAKTSSESAMQLVYSFSPQPQLSRTYTKDGAEYNTGLWLEDLDTFAADVAARHVGLHDKTLFTAYVDCIHWLQHATGQHAVHASTSLTSRPDPQPHQAAPHLSDMHLTGQVTWVGRSSLEVTLELTRRSSRHNGSTCHPHHPLRDPDTRPASGSESESAESSLPSSLPSSPRHTLPTPTAGSHQCQAEGASPPTPATSTAVHPQQAVHIRPGTPDHFHVASCDERMGPASAHSQEGSTTVEPEPGGSELVALARFIMAARDKSMSKAAAVPPLVMQNDPEALLAAQGAARQRARQHRREREASQELTSEELSLLSQLLAQQEHVTEQEHVTAPGAERSQRVHTDKQGTGQRSEAYPAVSAAACVQAPLKSHSQPKEPMHASNQSSHQQEGHRPDLSHLAPVSIRDTELVQTWVTQYQDRNTTGTVFGGQLLRYGHDMAMATAAAHAHEPCRLLSMQDVPFMAVVPLGCVFQLTGRVVYTDGPVLHVHVRAHRADEPSAAHTHHNHSAHQHDKTSKFSHGTGLTGGDSEPTNGHGQGQDRQVAGPRRHLTHSFFITLLTQSGGAVRPVVPHTLVEMREWLHAHRVHQELQGNSQLPP